MFTAPADTGIGQRWETEMTSPEELVQELKRVQRVRQDLLDPRSREALSRYVQDLEASLNAAQRASAVVSQLLPN